MKSIAIVLGSIMTFASVAHAQDARSRAQATCDLGHTK